MVDEERTVGQIKFRIRRVEIKRRWQGLLEKCQRSFDQASRTGSNNKVTQITFDGTNFAKTIVVGVAFKCFCQSGQLNRVTQRRGCTMRFDVTDTSGINICVVERSRDYRSLPVHAGRRKACLHATIVIDRRTFYHGIDRVTVRNRIGQPLQQHNGSTITENSSACIHIESACVTIRRKHGSILIQISAARRAGNRRATCKRHIALTTAQINHCLRNRDQRR